MNEAKERLVRLVASLSTKALVELFDETETNNDSSIYIVRGAIMDELEKRNPEAFDEWLDMDDPTNEALHILYSV